MRTLSKTFLTVSSLAVLGCFTGAAAHAQTISGTRTIALKNGESSELSDLWLIGANCNSMMTGTPEAEILDGPPGVTIAVKESMVTPRSYLCVKPIMGGKLMITAKDIEEPSFTTLVVRIKYHTRNGERQSSQVYKLSLIP
jgi:hypothetical protein